MENAPNTKGYHLAETQSAGFIADTYILPAYVSFEYCWFKEEDVCATFTGQWATFIRDIEIRRGKPVCQGHHPNLEGARIGPPVNDTSGSKVEGNDKVEFASPHHWLKEGRVFYLEGRVTWQIPCQFRVGSGDWFKPEGFEPAKQVATTASAGWCEVEKMGADKAYFLSDDPEKDKLFGDYDRIRNSWD